MAKYDFNTFKELYDCHIHYAYESQYGCHISIYEPVMGEKFDMITFHKLTIFSNGTLEYKGQYDTYDPRLWPKVKAFAEMLQETKAERILYVPTRS